MIVNWQEILGWNADRIDELRVAGYSYLREGKYDTACTFFEGLTELDPNNAYDAQILGALYLQMNQLPKALAALNKALEIQPQHAPTLLNKVKTLLGLNRKEEAFTMARALMNDPDPQIAGEAWALLQTYS